MSASEAEIVIRGCCHVYFALDIGFAVDLKRCVGLIQEAREDDGVQRHAPAPAYLNLQPSPLRVSQAIDPIRGPRFQTDSSVTATIYDFGAVSLDYRVPFDGTLEEIAALSAELYDNPLLEADARRRAERLLSEIGAAVRRPKVRDEVEDYIVFAVPDLEKYPQGAPVLIAEHMPTLARILSSNTKGLSRQQQQEELSRRIAYYDDDLTVVTWNAALVFGGNMEDVLAVLELANVQLRELHYLDDRLDDSLQEAYDTHAQPKNLKASMQRIRELMLDGQAFSEAVVNAFKPFPDAFLARVYALASQAMGLQHFDQSVKAKLNLLNTLYTTLSDEAEHRRSVRLEWIVIVLILIEVIMGFIEKLVPRWTGG